MSHEHAMENVGQSDTDCSECTQAPAGLSALGMVSPREEGGGRGRVGGGRGGKREGGKGKGRVGGGRTGFAARLGPGCCSDPALLTLPQRRAETMTDH